MIQKYEPELEAEFGSGSAVALVRSLCAQAEPYACKILDMAIEKFGIAQLVSEVALAYVCSERGILLRSNNTCVERNKASQVARPQTLIPAPSLTSLSFSVSSQTACTRTKFLLTKNNRLLLPPASTLIQLPRSLPLTRQTTCNERYVHSDSWRGVDLTWADPNNFDTVY